MKQSNSAIFMDRTLYKSYLSDENQTEEEKATPWLLKLRLLTKPVRTQNITNFIRQDKLH